MKEEARKTEKTMFFHTPQASEVRSLFRYTIAGKVIGDTLYLGISKCGRRDAFKRSIGRAIAEGRVLEGLKHPEKETLKRKFCAVPFDYKLGEPGFAKAFVNHAILAVKTVDRKWSKVNFEEIKRSHKKKAKVVSIEHY